MKYKGFIAAVAASAVVLTTGVALARQSEHHDRMNFETLDADGDGSITQAEMVAFGAGRMAEADSDGDGFLSQAELVEMGRKRAEEHATRMIERMDSDKDGKLSAEEMADGSRGQKMFERIDADKDGAITKAEFDAAHERMKSHRGGQGHKSKP